MFFLKLAGFALYRFKIMGGVLQSMAALFLLPPLLVLLTGQVMQGVIDPAGVPVAVVDLDKSEYSLTTVDRLADHPILSLTEYDEETARRKVVAGKKEVAFIIEKGFMDNILEERLDALVTIVRSPSSLLTELIGEIIAGEVIRLTSNVIAADAVLENYRNFGIMPDAPPERIWQEAWERTDSQWEPVPLVQLDSYYPGTVDAKVAGETAYRHAAGNLVFVLGLLSVLMMFLVIFLHGWIVAEKNAGIRPRLQASPVSINLYTAGNSLAVLAAVSLSSVFTLWLSSLFLDVAPVFTGPLLLLFFCYLLSCTGLALFLTAAARTAGQLQVSGVMVVVLTGVFGGIFSQLGHLNGTLGWLVKLMPQAWLLSGAREFLFYSMDWSSVAQPVIVLVLFFIIFSGLSLKVGDRND